MKMRQWARALGLTTLVAFSLVGPFQNCADNLNGSSNNSSLADSLPFAYDTTLDTIAYMSCSGGDVAAQREAIWTIRAGAFSPTAGIRLSDEYLAQTKNFVISQRAEALSQSVKNSNAVLQLALRPADNLQSILTSDGGDGISGNDFSAVTGPLDDPIVASQLASVDAKNPSRATYFSTMPGLSNRRIDNVIRFTKDENLAGQVRGFLASSAILTATYTMDLMPNTNARGPSGAIAKTAYGRGYKINFNIPAGDTVARVLSTIDEVDLMTGRSPADASSWLCSNDMRFRIAKFCEGTAGALTTDTCRCQPDTGDPVALARIRRALRVEHWWVDTTNRCIVQKGGGQQCYPNNQTTAATGNHYASICFRQ